MKCMDQMPTPITHEAPANQAQKARRLAKTKRPAISKARKEANTAMPQERATVLGSKLKLSTPP